MTMRGKNADGSRPGVFPRALRGGEEKGPRYPAWYAGLISRNLSGCPQGGAGCGRRGSSLSNPEGLWKLAGGITPPVFMSFWVAAPEGAGEIRSELPTTSPQEPLIKLDAAAHQKVPIFLLKRTLAMVIRLICDVFACRFK